MRSSLFFFFFATACGRIADEEPSAPAPPPLDPIVDSPPASVASANGHTVAATPASPRGDEPPPRGKSVGDVVCSLSDLAYPPSEAGPLAVVDGMVFWQFHQTAPPSYYGIAACPVTGDLPLIMRLSVSAFRLAIGNDPVFQVPGESIKIMRGTSYTYVSLPDSTTECAAIAASKSRVFCRVGGEVRVWDYEWTDYPILANMTGPTTLATGLVSGRDLALAGDDLFASDTGGRIARASASAAGSFSTLASGISNGPLALTPTSGHLVWWERAPVAGWSSGPIRSMPRAGGAIAHLGDGDGVALAADDDAVWALTVDVNENTTIMRFPRAGKAIPAAGHGTALTVDATHVYWSADDGRIRRTPKP